MTQVALAWRPVASASSLLHRQCLSGRVPVVWQSRVCRHLVGYCCSTTIGSQQQFRAQCDVAAAPSVQDAPTTDATFRYRSFEWETSCGERHVYEYVVAQQPAGGQTAKRDALSALESDLPQSPSGWSIILIPSVSFVCGGKEEMRPLATGLSQRGHRCYILEWPGWTCDAQTNWALARCKPEELGEEYQDFWCQLLEHLAEAEARVDAPQPQLCVVGAGHAAVYALRALEVLKSWRAAESIAGGSCYRGLHFSSLVLLAPSWRTAHHRLLGQWSFLQPARACRIMGEWLHSESRLGRLLRSFFFSGRRFRKHYGPGAVPVASSSSEDSRSVLVAKWLQRRPRPYVQTDSAALWGLLDPSGSPDSAAIAGEVEVLLDSLDHGVLLVLPESDSPGMSSASAGRGVDAVAALAPSQASVLPSTGLAGLGDALATWEGRGGDAVRAVALVHESSPSAVLWEVDQWLSRSSAWRSDVG